MMSRRTRSGALRSTARRAASPSSATLSLKSPRSASTSMSTLAFTSSTISTRQSARSLISGMAASEGCARFGGQGAHAGGDLLAQLGQELAHGLDAGAGLGARRLAGQRAALEL